MRIDKERISPLQLAFGITCFIQGTTMRSVFLSSITGVDSWAMALTGALVFLPMLFGYIALIRMFPGKCLFEINEEVFGRVGGMIFSAVYLYFFATLTALNGLDLTFFVSDFMMPGTPFFFIIITFYAACVYAVRKGLESYMRLSPIISIGATLIVAVNFLLVLKDVDLSYLFPMFQQPAIKYIQGTHVTATIPYGETIVFLMLTSNLGEGKDPGKPLIASLILSALFMFLIVFRDIISLGPLISYFSLPSFEAVRVINIQHIITRIESLFAITNVSLLFIKISMLIYVCTHGLSHMVRVKQYKHLVIPITALLLAYSLTIYDSTIVHGYTGSYVVPFIWVIFEYLMPLFTLIVAAINRKKTGKAAAKA